MNPNPSPVGIINGRDDPSADSLSSAPNMTTAAFGWMRPIVLTIVRKIVQDYETKEVQVEHRTQGSVQPMAASRLLIKPEGERSWNWWTVIVPLNLPIQTDDVIIWKGTRLRVMSEGDWSDNGFKAYDAVNDYAYKPLQS